MNKKNNRKGFTIVELVIVIAVIAILATVLVPTFGNVIEKANITSAKQNAKNTYTEYVAGVEYDKGETAAATVYFVDGNYTVTIVDGAVTDCVLTEKWAEPADCYNKLNDDATVELVVVDGCDTEGCTHGVVEEEDGE